MHAAQQSWWGFDWGVSNPGASSLILAMLLVAVWGFVFWRPIGFWISLGLTLIIGTGLAIYHPTDGGAIGAMAGLGWIAFWIYPELLRTQVISFIAVGVIFGVGAALIPKNPAWTKVVGEEGGPIASRLAIWKAVPHMLLDASEGWEVSSPGGWDATGTGPDYMLGYQPLDESFQDYRTLVSSHFTWLAEHDWRGRILYVCAWAFAGLMVWPSREHRWLAVVSGIWVCLGVAGLFSTALTAPVVWIIPGMALAITVGFRVFSRTWPAWCIWLVAPIGASVGLMILIGLGAILFPLQVPVHREGERTILGDGAPTVWFVRPYVDVLGHHFGQGIRGIVLAARAAGHPIAIGVVRSLDDVPTQNATEAIYVFSYKNISDPLPADAERLIFLNTWLTKSVEWPAERFGKKDVALLGTGMMHSNSEGLATDKDRWKGIAANDPSFSYLTPKLGYFLPTPLWKETVLKVILENSSTKSASN